MNVLLLDTKTGIRKYSNEWSDVDFSVYWWTEGNGSCDCNRALVFDIEDNNHTNSGMCLGTNRFLVVDVSGDLEGHSKEEILKTINQEYPANLTTKYLP